MWWLTDGMPRATGSSRWWSRARTNIWTLNRTGPGHDRVCWFARCRDHTRAIGRSADGWPWCHHRTANRTRGDRFYDDGLGRMYNHWAPTWHASRMRHCDDWAGHRRWTVGDDPLPRVNRASENHGSSQWAVPRCHMPVVVDGMMATVIVDGRIATPPYVVEGPPNIAAPRQSKAKAHIPEEAHAGPEAYAQ